MEDCSGKSDSCQFQAKSFISSQDPLNYVIGVCCFLVVANPFCTAQKVPCGFRCANLKTVSVNFDILIV